MFTSQIREQYFVVHEEDGKRRNLFLRWHIVFTDKFKIRCQTSDRKGLSCNSTTIYLPLLYPPIALMAMVITERQEITSSKTRVLFVLTPIVVFCAALISLVGSNLK